MQEQQVDETTEPKGVHGDGHPSDEGHADSRTPGGEDAPTEDDTHDESSTDETDEDVFPRKVVEDLRQESGRYRQRAQKAEQRLHSELVRATGRLADPDDLPFAAEHLDDAERLTAAIDELLERKPHLAARRPSGDIGQGATKSAGPVSLHDILRSSA